MKKIIKAPLILCGVLLFVVLTDIGCIFKAISGIPCPGCGVTRAVLSFIEGDWHLAFYYHPLFWLTIPVLFIAVMKQEAIFKSSNFNKFFWITITVMYISVYAVRMVMLFPHTAPMDVNTDAVLYPLYQEILSLFK